jgi:hypothetical protein
MMFTVVINHEGIFVANGGCTWGAVVVAAILAIVGISGGSLIGAVAPLLIVPFVILMANLDHHYQAALARERSFPPGFKDLSDDTWEGYER